MAESVPSGKALPVLDVGGRTGQWLGVGGILACSLCCLSIPGIATALGAVGLGFLRNDRILFPASVVFAAVVGWAFHRAWRRHRIAGPGLLALAVVAMVVFYAIEARGRWTLLAFAGSCVLASMYGFLQGAWPFGLVETVWAGVALWRFGRWPQREKKSMREEIDRP